MKNRIRELRKERGMNQEVLADMVGSSQQTISKVERNTESLNIGLLIEIADFFEVTTDYMLCLSDEKRGSRHTDHSHKKIDEYYGLISEYEELDEPNQNVVRVMIRALKEEQKKKDVGR